jgi:secreted trypsin-like serine protease
MNFSGGPLMIQTSDDLWEIIGVTSYGKGCGRLNELGVYTRVSMYRNWIDMMISNLDDDSSRLYNKPDNFFFNSACHSSKNVFLLFYLLVIGINKLLIQ